MKEVAVKYHSQGFSCSESIVKVAVDAGLCDASMLSVATSFSAGMSDGCLCGAIAGAQMVIGYNYGKENKFGNEVIAREKANAFIQEFKKNHKAACCRILTANYDFDSAERRQNCEKLVQDCAVILENMLIKKASV